MRLDEVETLFSSRCRYHCSISSSTCGRGMRYVDDNRNSIGIIMNNSSSCCFQSSAVAAIAVVSESPKKRENRSQKRYQCVLEAI